MKRERPKRSPVAPRRGLPGLETRLKIRRRPQEVLVDLHDTLSGQSLSTTVELDKGRATRTDGG
ncbi:MAG: hypothetical protein GY856_46325 [bacterium]|nr:hypothetical protein [bacterium]